MAMADRAQMTQFLNSSNWLPIQCVLKRLYSDFIVIEKPTIDTVLVACAELPLVPKINYQLEVKDDKRSDRKRGLDVENDTNEQASENKRSKHDYLDEASDSTAAEIILVEKSSEDICNVNTSLTESPKTEFSSVLPDIFTEDDRRAIVDVAECRTDEFVLDISTFGKSARRAGYDYLRANFDSTLVTQSVDGRLRIRRKDGVIKEVNRPPKDKAEKTKQKGNLFFTMTKENMDTNRAIKLIANYTGNMNTSQFSLAGLKDRRAITTQLVCAQHATLEHVLKASLRLRGISLCNFYYSFRRPLKLGELWGNHFEIILRELDIDPVTAENVIAQRVEHWKRDGFLNYFGSQRFGALHVNTADVGRLLVSGRYEDAVKALLEPRNGFDPLEKAYVEYAKSGDAKTALAEMRKECSARGLKANPYYDTIEGRLLKALADNDGCAQKAIMQMSRETRSLYVHAYQSQVFNRIVSRRVEKYGTKVLPGDLDAKGQQPEELNIEDVHLPLPSLGQKYPANETKDWYNEIAEEDGISDKCFADMEKNFIIGEVYRQMIVKPINVEWELIRHEDSRAVLQSSPFMPEDSNARNWNDKKGGKRKKPTKKDGVSVQMKSEKVTEIGDGNKVEDETNDKDNAEKPLEDESNKNEDEKNEDQKDKPQKDESEKNEAEKNEDQNNKPPTDESKKQYISLRIKFDLPSCCYATVALRELMRTDFSKHAQKEYEKGLLPVV